MESHKLSFNYVNPVKQRFGDMFFSQIKQTPGVYFMLGDNNAILYIGKAKNLKARLVTYSRAKPGTAPEHILEMLESVTSIQWYECTSEDEALSRESELLHAVRPPYNLAGTEAEHYLFIGVKKGNHSITRLSHPGNLWIDFKLSSRKFKKEERYAVYGCYKHRRKVKNGYSALLRLIYAATTEKERFSYPARITRTSPAWLYSAELPRVWESDLDRFLKGKSSKLLNLLVWKLLENDNIPKFMRSSLQDDIEILKKFYVLGPLNTYQLKQKHQLRTQVISHVLMDSYITSELKFAPSTAQITEPASKVKHGQKIKMPTPSAPR